ncbi:major capsid protein [Salmonella enterica subsp. enterica serovar Alachua]|nr:major capsid protein [Salmonella enterica subsp. enterica serovar Alachua]
MASPNIYDTATLIQLVPNLKTSQNFLLDRFFPNIVTSDTEFVAIDVDVGARRMSPFCSPLVEGKLVEQRRYQTDTFKPPYIKDKRAPDLRKPIRRQVGERIGGEYTAAEREQLNIQFEMADQIDMLNRRLEWMAASALQSGSVTVSGEGFPTTVIDFGRDSALTVALTGSSAWPLSVATTSENTIPTDCIEDWQTTVLQKSGAVCTDIIFTNKSWKAFRKDSTIKESAIIMPAQNSSGNIVNPGSQIAKGAIHKGTWGSYELWLYNDWYVDPDTGEEEPMLPDGMVLMCGPQMQGTRAFAAIVDPAFAYGPMAYAPKSWLVEDPAQRMLLMQSSPLVIPSQVNACLAAMVIDED